MLIYILTPFELYPGAIKIVDSDISNYPEISIDYFVFDSSYSRIFPNSLQEYSIYDNGKSTPPANILCNSSTPDFNKSITICFDLALNFSATGISNFNSALNLSGNIIEYSDSLTTKCSITSFDERSNLNLDFIYDRNRLFSALDYLKPSRGSNFDEGLLSVPTGALPISLDSESPCSIILITDGLGPISADSIINIANENNIKIYVVSFGFKISDDLKRISEQTNAKWFERVHNQDDTDLLANVLLNFIYGYQPCRLNFTADFSCMNFHTLSLGISKLNSYDSTDYFITDSQKPFFESSPSFVGFGALLPPTVKDEKIVITSKNANIFIDSFSVNNTHFKIISGDLKNSMLLKDSKHEVTVRFSPTDSAIVFGRLTIHTPEACFGKEIPFTGGYPNTPPISRTINLINPNGGETFIVGDTTYVTWDGLLPSDVIQLQFSKDNGFTWDSLAQNVNGLSYEWIIPDKVSDKCLINAIQLWPNNIGRTMDFKHKQGVNSAVFSSDYNIVLTASADTTARLWNSNNGKEIIRFIGHTQPVLWADMSPDMKFVATASEDSTIMIWNASTAAKIATLNNHKYHVRSVRFSPDGKHIISAGRDGYCLVWETNTWKLVDTIDYQPGQLWYAEYSPDGTKIVVAGNDRKVKTFNSSDGSFFKEFDTGIVQNGQGLNVHACFSPDMEKLVTASWFGKAIVWDFISGDTLCCVQHIDSTGSTSAIFSASFDPTSDTLLTAGFDHHARMWNANTGEFITTLYEHKSSVKTATFNFDGSRVLTSSWDFTAKIWNRDSIALQTDLSDGNFSIKKAKIFVEDISFGQVPYGSIVDTVITSFISNQTGYPIVVRDIRIEGISANDYTILNGFAPFIIDSNQSVPFEIRFKPENLGIRPASIKIIIPDETITSDLFGEGIPRDLRAEVNVVNFGEVELGDLKDTLVNVFIKNMSFDPVRIDNIYIGGPDTVHFKDQSAIYQITLAPNQSIEAKLRYIPEFNERNNGHIIFEHNGKEKKTRVSLFGQGVDEIVYDIELLLEDHFAKPGDIVSIPIKIKSVQSIIESGILGIQSKLTFNSTLLEPIDNSIVSEKTGFENTITLDMPFNEANGDILRTVDFIVGLGNDTITPLKLFDSHPIDAKKLRINETSSTFYLEGFCSDGSLRLIDTEGEINLSQNSPNPFSDYTEIEFEVIENGLTELFLTDISGNHIKTILGEFLPKGNHIIVISSEDMNSGHYFVNMRTPTKLYSRKLILEK